MWVVGGLRQRIGKGIAFLAAGGVQNQTHFSFSKRKCGCFLGIPLVKKILLVCGSCFVKLYTTDYHTFTQHSILG